MKPVLYINTPMKIMNPEYDKIDVVPFDIRIRGQLGGELELLSWIVPGMWQWICCPDPTNSGRPFRR